MSKPKPVKYRVIELPPDGDDESRWMYGVLGELIAEHHEHLEDASILLVWRDSWSPDQDGRETIGQCKKLTDPQRLIHGVDFLILLSRDRWEGLEPVQRRALIDHELCHAAVSMDQETGEPKLDALGRKVYRIRKHTIEEFDEVVARHGVYMRDVYRFGAVVKRAKQLGLFETPALRSVS